MTFELESIEATTGSNGDCEFSWTIVRTKKDPQGKVISVTNFSDEAAFGCPNTQIVTVHCDPAKTCPGYELTLTCSMDMGPGGAGG